MSDELEKSKEVKKENEEIILREIHNFQEKYKNIRYKLINEFKMLCDHIYVGVSISIY